MPKVSVIIPVYGVEKYIERCARSLFEQTLDDIEYLFIDDCTPDKSVEILKRVLDDYPQRKEQVVIHRMERNSGQAVVRKWGIINAKGDYIIHCDSDDWVDCRIYEKLYKKAIFDKSDVVFCDYYIVDKKPPYRIFRKELKDFSNRSILIKLLTSYALNPIWSVLTKRELYQGIIYPECAQSEDKTILIQVCNHSNKNSAIDEPLYYYRNNPTSISNNISTKALIKRYEQSYNNMQIVLEYMSRLGIEDEYETYLDIYKYNLRSFFENNLRNKSCRILWENTYPSLTYRIYFNHGLSFKNKFLYALKLCKVKTFNLFRIDYE